jgi:glycine cleavage system transcriptional repressor
MTLAISVTGKDRPGIVAALSGAIVRSGGNLEDASMTILEGEFAMIFLASLKSKSSLEKLTRQISVLRIKFHLSIGIREIKRRLVRGEKHEKGTDPWVVSVLGRDRSGIVHCVCSAISTVGLNITDLNSKILGRGKKSSYVLVLEVDMPRRGGKMARLKRRFLTLEKKLRISITFQPVETARL